MKTNCKRCQTEMEYQQLANGRGGFFVWKPTYCNECGEVVKKETGEFEKSEKQRIRAKEWENICPPIYQDTELDRIRTQISAETIKNVLEWEPNPIGIGLAGKTGKGKTRLVFFLLESLYIQGFNLRAISAKKFEKYCHEMFSDKSDARQNIEHLHKTKILFIDDIGKEKFTERVESEFYDLIEHRTSYKLPILWTSNATSQLLQKMMSEDRGEPIIRRLKEFSTIYGV